MLYLLYLPYIRNFSKKEVALLKAVDGFRYILSLFRSHHLMAGQTEFLLVYAFGDGKGKTVP